MSNEIQAKPSRSYEIELDIYVEADVDKFTWAVIDEMGRLVAAKPMDRRPEGAQVPLGQDFKVTVQEKDFQYVAAYDDAENLFTNRSGFGGFPKGDYQVHLYVGHPRRGAKVQNAFRSLGEPVADDAFAVRDNAFSSDRDEPGGEKALKVALVREGPFGQAERLSPVSYSGFRTYLAKRWGDDKPYDDANSWPAFGGKPYQAIRDAAREYVSEAKVSSFGDLLPAGYEDKKLDETEEQYPKILIPRNDPGTAYLPAVELIWNYWLEEGMLVQTLNVILARFQNRRLQGRDPLARFDITPLLPLRNRLWGFAEDEMHRLTIRRRAVEYEYEYGFSLIGRAVPRPHTVVERRNGFISTFHQVLFLAHRFFKDVDDLTVQPDAFPLYRALRDCHIVLSQGTQNQYGEMAVAARAEFLVMQSILAEPQMREFLGGRPMTPYPEEWMDRVDGMKTIQGWTDTSIMHFNDLAEIGEQLVLTIRLGNWADPEVGGKQASNWAQAFRNGIQKYVAAYRTATGVDLAEEPNSEKPSTLLARRLSGARIRA